MRSRLVALTGLLLILTGCDSGAESEAERRAAPDEAVTVLADALVTGDFAAVAFAQDPPDAVATDYAEVVEAMAVKGESLKPLVLPGSIDTEGATAVADLQWTWPITEDDSWAYTTQATLRRVDDEWQVVWDHSVIEPSLGDGTTLEITPIQARRADITGARGLALVTARPVVRFGIDRSLVPAARAGQSAKRLAQLVGIDVTPYVAAVEAAGDLAFIEAIVYRSDQVPPKVASAYDVIKGARLVGGDIPLAPTRDFAAPILGSVGDVTAEMIEDNPDYQVGDTAGLSGLQARYDEQLQGTAGVVVNAVGSDGKEREVFRSDAQSGTPLKLTMDLDLQVEAESLLADVAPSSAIVAIRPSDGAILAAANGPGAQGYNIATFGQFAPGSTFKSVSSLALLRSGLTPDTPVPCTATITVDGKVFKNYSDYPSAATGQIPFRTALANSCNTAFIAQAKRLGELDLFNAAAALGMGLDHDLGFPAYFGSVEPAGSPTEKAANMIGQGKILASPMVMATVIASIQQGSLVIPRLIESVKVTPPEVTPLTGGEADALRSLLRGVVTGGSGRGLLDVPGPEVIAKTGTAEFSRNGRIETHAWMIAAQGDLAVAVFVEVGSSGSGTAGPILEAFLRAAR